MRLGKANKKVVVLLQVPSFPYEPKECLKRYIAIKKVEPMTCKIDRNSVAAASNAYLASIERLQKKFPKVIFFSPDKFLCNEISCSALIDDKIIYSDRNHLNRFGSVYFGDKFSF